MYHESNTITRYNYACYCHNYISRSYHLDTIDLPYKYIKGYGEMFGGGYIFFLILTAFPLLGALFGSNNLAQLPVPAALTILLSFMISPILATINYNKAAVPSLKVVQANSKKLTRQEFFSDMYKVERIPG